MTPEEMTAKMAALYEDEEFTAKVAACQNVQQMAELFAQEGLPVTPEVLEAVLAKANEEGEMDEEDLDSVAGGIWLPFLFPFPIPFPIPRPRPGWPRRPRRW